MIAKHRRTDHAPPRAPLHPAHVYHPAAELALEEEESYDTFEYIADEPYTDETASTALTSTGSGGGGGGLNITSGPSSSTHRRLSMAVGEEDVQQQEIDYAPIDVTSPPNAAAAAAATPPQFAQKPNSSTRHANLAAPCSAVRVHALSVQSPQHDTTLLSVSSPTVASVGTAPALAAPSSEPDAPRFGLVGVYLALIGAQLCWSGFHLFAKIALAYMSPLVLPWLRACGVAPVLGLICYWQDRNFWRVSRADLIQILICSLLLCCGALQLFCLGLMLTTAADGGITQPAIPVFAALLAIAMGREKRSLLKFIGIGSAVAGTVCIVMGETYLVPAMRAESDESTLEPNVTPANRLLGLGCFMLQCFLFSLYLLVQKPLLARVPPATITFYTFLFGIPGTTLIALPFAVRMDWASLPAIWFGAIAYTVLMASVVAFMLFSYATKHLPATASAMGVTLQPFFSSVLGATILGETLTYLHVIGGAFLIAGLVVVLISRSHEAKAKAAEAQREAARREEFEENTAVALAIGSPSVEDAATTSAGANRIDNAALLAALHSPILNDAISVSSSELQIQSLHPRPSGASSSSWLLPSPQQRTRVASVDGGHVIETDDDASISMLSPSSRASSGNVAHPDRATAAPSFTAVASSPCDESSLGAA